MKSLMCYLLLVILGACQSSTPLPTEPTPNIKYREHHIINNNRDKHLEDMQIEIRRLHKRIEYGE